MTDITKLDVGLPSSKRTRPIRYIVCHHTVTRSPEATQRVLRARGLSTHYEVAPDGRIYEYLNPAIRKAWHAREWNAHGIGVDLTGPPGRTDSQPVMPYPNAQVQAFAWLIAWLIARFGLKLSGVPGSVARWKYNSTWKWRLGWPIVMPHAAIQRGKVDPSDWRLDGTAWDTVLRPAILGWPGADPAGTARKERLDNATVPL